VGASIQNECCQPERLRLCCWQSRRQRAPFLASKAMNRQVTKCSPAATVWVRDTHSAWGLICKIQVHSQEELAVSVLRACQLPTTCATGPGCNSSSSMHHGERTVLHPLRPVPLRDLVICMNAKFQPRLRVAPSTRGEGWGAASFRGGIGQLVSR
jgi:hypothetical protein